VADSEDASRDLPEGAGDVGSVVGDAAQRVRHGHRWHALAEQLCDHVVPARAVRERTVHERDRGA